ncbi:DUF3040 domain-containing protein [Jongsikchunia kroppenstedtii]|uniref:DUF3040 domain-containing protein n=1 Tax=Jongsikchunia kroppenstedtii TaxID=1121721 RepID=UPI000477687F|nr:DUF3040 domain-containing protein [Jongsikchunia kroppenstedtii]
MPLSEHEQRMLEQIESALYAEDPKFASHVRGRRFGGGGSVSRRRIQAASVFVIGLGLLIGGLVANVTVSGFPILSLIGFLVMFAAGLMALWGFTSGSSGSQSSPSTGSARSGRRSGRKFSERMEDRFNRRFERGE